MTVACIKITWKIPQDIKILGWCPTTQYWCPATQGQSYFMERRCLFSLGWPPFLWWCQNKNALWYKNAEVVLVPCLHMEVHPYSYFWWCGYFWGPWMSFVTRDEFSVSVTRITSRIGVSWTHSLPLYF